MFFYFKIKVFPTLLCFLLYIMYLNDILNICLLFVIILFRIMISTPLADTTSPFINEYRLITPLLGCRAITSTHKDILTSSEKTLKQSNMLFCIEANSQKINRRIQRNITCLFLWTSIHMKVHAQTKAFSFSLSPYEVFPLLQVVHHIRLVDSLYNNII